MDDYAEKAKQAGRAATEHGEEFIDEMQQRGREFMDDAQVRGRRALSDAGDLVAEHPGAAVSAAFLAGIAVATLFMRRD